MNHDLKIEDSYLDNLISQRKKCEIRPNDRDYQKGDTLTFMKYRATRPHEKYAFKITHIHSGLGLKEGYVVLSVELLEE